MANPEHVAVARGRSFAIARWRARSFQTRAHLDLSGAYLSGARMPGVDLSHDDLTEIDLTSADLRHGNFNGARMRQAHLSRCNLNRASFEEAQASGAFFTRSDLRGGNFCNADLRGADLSNCDLAFAAMAGANLAGADLTEADLTMADLTDANLSGARLNAACLDIANLSRCDLRRASLVRTRLDCALLQDGVVDMTLFADCDLGAALGLETVRHQGPSIVGADTLARSGGGVSKVFLQSAGVPPDFIEFVGREFAARGFAVGNGRAEQASAPTPHRRILLIGAAADGAVVAWLEREMRRRGAQCWSLLADDEEAIYNAQVFPPMSRFRNYDRVALLCSYAALESPACWRLYREIMQRQSDSAARRVHVAAVTLDDCLENDTEELYGMLRDGPGARLRLRKDGKGGYRRDVPGVLAVLTADWRAASPSDNWPDAPESVGVP